MGMLDAVVLNTVNQIKAMVASLSVGGSNPVTDTKVAELRTGLTDTRMSNLDNIDTSTMAQIDLIKADLDTVLYHIVTSDSGLNTIKYQVNGLESAIISVLDSDAALDVKLTAVKAVVDALRLGLTDLRMGYLDNIPTIKTSTDNLAAIKTSTDRITSTWAGKLDSLRAAYTDTRAGFLDYIDSLNTRLSGVWSDRLTSLRTAYTDVRAGYLDLVNTLNTRLSAVWAAKLDSLRTGLTDQRMANLDAIPESRMAKVDLLRTGLTDARMGYLDIIPGITAGLGPAPTSRPYRNNAVGGCFQSISGITYHVSSADPGSSITTAITSNTNASYTPLNITGSGVLKSFFVNYSLNTTATMATFTVIVKLWIDGVLYMTRSSSRSGGWSATSSFQGRVPMVGCFSINQNNTAGWTNYIHLTGTEEVRFNASLGVSIEVVAAGCVFSSGYAQSAIDYQLN